MKKRLLKVCIVFLLLMNINVFVHADTDEIPYNDFSILAEVNTNQVDENVSYYDLKLDVGGSTATYININNIGSKDMIAEIRINNGVNRANASKDYQSQDLASDYIPYSFVDIARVSPSKVSVPANSSLTIPIEIQMPNSEVDGPILGAVEIFGYTDKVNGDTEEGALINSIVSYLHAYKVWNTSKEIKQELYLVSDEVVSANYLPTFSFNMENPNAASLGDIKIEGTITDIESDKVVGELLTENGQILPYSAFPIQINFLDSNMRMEASDYNYSIKVTSDKDTWNFDGVISVEKQDSQRVNDESEFEYYQDNTLAYVLIGVVAFLLVLIIIMFFYFKSKKNKA